MLPQSLTGRQEKVQKGGEADLRWLEGGPREAQDAKLLDILGLGSMARPCPLHKQFTIGAGGGKL